MDLTFDALINESGVSKMRVFLSDVLFDREKSGDKTIFIPLGKSDCTVFRKVMSAPPTARMGFRCPRVNRQAASKGTAWWQHIGFRRKRGCTF